MLGRSGLTDVTVLANAGWLGDGRVPAKPTPKASQY
jgi:hypothetical protein